jgi:cytochrome oxidase Cu insertion factor (SCO1/SenC/PrrC family)
VGPRALIAALALGLAVFGHGLAAAQPDPFAAMNALRVTPPAAMPVVAFQTLDGQPASLAALRGRPVLLTFFTTW